MSDAILADSDQQRFTWDPAGRMTITPITAATPLLDKTLCYALQALVDPDDATAYRVYIMMIGNIQDVASWWRYYLRQYKLTADHQMTLIGEKHYTDYYTSSGRQSMAGTYINDIHIADAGRVVHLIDVNKGLDIYEYTATAYGTDWASENTYDLHADYNLNRTNLKFLPGGRHVQDIDDSGRLVLLECTPGDHTNLAAAPAKTRYIENVRDLNNNDLAYSAIMARADGGQIVEIVNVATDSLASRDYVKLYTVRDTDRGARSEYLQHDIGYLRDNAFLASAPTNSDRNILSWTEDGKVALILHQTSGARQGDAVRLYRAERNAGLSTITYHLFGGGGAGAAAAGSGASRTGGGGGGAGHYLRRTLTAATGDQIAIGIGTGGTVTDTAGGTTTARAPGGDLSAPGGTRANRSTGGDSGSDIDGTTASYLGGAGSGVYAGGGAGSGGFGESAGSASSGAGGPGVDLSALGLGTVGQGGQGGAATPATPSSAQGGAGQGRTSTAASPGGDGSTVLVVPTSVYSGVHTGSPSVTESGDQTVLKYSADGRYTVGMPGYPADYTTAPVLPYRIVALRRTGTVIDMPSSESSYRNFGGLLSTPAAAGGGQIGLLVVAGSSASRSRRFIYQFTTPNTSGRLQGLAYKRKNAGFFNNEIPASVMLGKGYKELGVFDQTQQKIRSYPITTAGDISTVSRTGTTSTTLTGQKAPAAGETFVMAFTDLDDEISGRQATYILGSDGTSTRLSRYYSATATTFTSWRSSDGEVLERKGLTYGDFGSPTGAPIPPGAIYASLSSDRHHLLLLYPNGDLACYRLLGGRPWISVRNLTTMGQANLGSGSSRYTSVMWSGDLHVLVTDSVTNQIVEYSIA